MLEFKHSYQVKPSRDPEMFMEHRNSPIISAKYGHARLLSALAVRNSHPVTGRPQTSDRTPGGMLRA